LGIVKQHKCDIVFLRILCYNEYIRKHFHVQKE